MKICTRCKTVKAETEFHKKGGTRGFKRVAECKKCAAIRNKAWLLANPKAGASYSKKAREARPDVARAYHLRRVFGISLEKYAELLVLQSGVCAICKQKGKSGRRLAIDHLHGVNPIIVRGLLCMSCNQGIGLFQDSPSLLRAAADYLEKRP